MHFKYPCISRVWYISAALLPPSTQHSLIYIRHRRLWLLCTTLLMLSSQAAVCLRCNLRIDPGSDICVVTGGRIDQQLVARKKSKPLSKPWWTVEGGAEHYAAATAGQKKRQATDEQIALMVKRFNQWWEIFHKMKIGFQFGREDYRYITPSEAALARNNILNLRLQAMGITNHITIMEGFAGTGADTISFISDIKPTPKRILACDSNQTKRAQIEQNITNFVDAYKTRYSPKKVPDVKYYPMEVHTMLEHKAPVGAIDLLYLDPPWELVEGKDASGPELVRWLAKNVFSQFSLLWKDNRPKLIIIKTRFNADEMKTLNIDGYLFVDTLDFTPFHRTVYFHTLQSTECRTHHVWLPSRQYVDLNPAAARGNYLKDAKYGQTYQIAYMQKEDKLLYWHKVPGAIENRAGAHEDDAEYAVISHDNTPHNTFTVQPGRKRRGKGNHTSDPESDGNKKSSPLRAQYKEATKKNGFDVLSHL